MLGVVAVHRAVYSPLPVRPHPHSLFSPFSSNPPLYFCSSSSSSHGKSLSLNRPTRHPLLANSASNFPRDGPDDDGGDEVLPVLDSASRNSEGEDGFEIEVEKVGEQKNRRRIQSRVRVNADLESVWSVLTDYEGLADFIPSLAVSQLLEKKDKFARLYQVMDPLRAATFEVGQQNLAFGLKFDAKGVLDCYERDLQGKSSVIELCTVHGISNIEYDVDEDEKILVGKEFQTTLSYVVELVPKLWLPVRLIEGRLCREVKTNLLCVREEAQRIQRLKGEMLDICSVNLEHKHDELLLCFFFMDKLKVPKMYHISQIMPPTTMVIVMMSYCDKSQEPCAEKEKYDAKSCYLLSYKVHLLKLIRRRYKFSIGFQPIFVTETIERLHVSSVPICCKLEEPMTASGAQRSSCFDQSALSTGTIDRKVHTSSPLKTGKIVQQQPAKAMAASSLVTILSFLFLVSSNLAADSDMLQDICVADLVGVRVNGFACKPAATVTEADFFFQGLAKPGAATNTTMGSLVTAANVEKIPGLNTLGVSMSRVDYAPGGLNPPHTHPRATEIVFVLEGTLDVGFITTANKLIAKTITKGDVFVFPRGLVHFQKNNADVPAAALAAFNSQLPGTQSLAATLFAATPSVPDHVLTKAFQIGTKEVEKIKSRLQPKK
ncbi:Polyketide cyclase / dehydrase and lipid transport [Musa troglodytarum]|uniref:Polyketide cyclase / dehydrase and lipid transport n=1 Tax=Musa troglodytarum TaxID=320322 RepID=A0A9E7K4I7_9LILI|nr:Polyketide cyclase / dehydrase and lipid transport [Musa troglodytarum]